MIQGSILLAFGIGGPELAILLLMGLFLVGLILGIVAIVRACAKNTPPAAPQNSTQSRLNELDALLSSGAITKDEYDEKRRQIIDDL